MKDLFSEMFYGFIAISMLIELLGGDLYCMLFAIDRVAELLDIGVSLAYQHLLILAIWNTLSCVGAAMVFYGLYFHEKMYFRRVGNLLTVVGLLSYGSYQFWFATNHLGEVGFYVKGAAIVYILFGIVAWYLSKGLSGSGWRPAQLVESGNPYRPDDTLARVKDYGW
jgi:hypothetical protein